MKMREKLICPIALSSPNGIVGMIMRMVIYDFRSLFLSEFVTSS
jgi:hypothetical protein